MLGPNTASSKLQAPLSMALFSTVTKRAIFLTSPGIRHSLSTTASSPPPPDQTVVTTAVSLLKNHRSKSRWTHLRSLFPAGFHPSEVSEIVIQLRNNPHLALNFFIYTVRHSLCNHSLLSYATIIHVLSRSRQKDHAQNLIQTAIRKFEGTQVPNFPSKPPKLFETLIKTYRKCDSAPFVFDLLIKACLQSKRIQQSIEIVRMLRSKGMFPMISTCNSLITSVSKRSGSSAGYDIYKEIFGFNLEIELKTGNGIKVVYPNVHTFNIIMLAFYRDGLIGNVEEVWGEMERRNCIPSVYSYCILLAGYCDDGRMEEAMRIWEEMGIKGLKHDIMAYNTIIGGFCEIGEVTKAEDFFREMGLNKEESTCLTFEHLISGYCKIRDVDSAMLLYKDMCRKGFRPENLTIDAVVKGLCEKSRASEALEVLRIAMKKQDYNPKVGSYEVLIKGLCEEGRMEEGLKLQAEMVGKGYEPNVEIYTDFIDGYMKLGNKELADKLRKEVLEMQKLSLGLLQFS